MPKRYVLIDSEGYVANTILWDGETEWTPPEGYIVTLEDSRKAKAAIRKTNKRDERLSLESAQQSEGVEVTSGRSK